MKKLYTIGLLSGLVLAAPSLTARTLTPAQALQRLDGAPATKMMKARPVASQIKLAHTFTASDSAKPMVYVFDKGAGNGYLVMAADDLFPAVIGYGDHGTFDIATVPAAMKSFIEDYARQMEYITASYADKAALSAVADDGDERQPVAPLLKSTWNQDAPYNGMAPTLELIDSETGKVTGQTIETPTGCVATSMAQVMYYHKWPDTGTGSHGYDWQPYRDVLKKNLKCDFSQTSFDWDNMLDNYTEGYYSEKQAQAVAQLMYACGISVDMNYNTDAAGGSGAQSKKQASALPAYFKYSKGIRYKYRDFCTSAEFEDAIYNDLSQGLPVLYHGRGTAGGHSFVCDGYAGNHYFHFNWGWGGMSDGYFYLARLDPANLGIGGGGGAFNTCQGIIYNVRPVRDGVDNGTPELPYFVCNGNFDFLQEKTVTATDGKDHAFAFFTVTSPMAYYGNAGIFNLSASDFNGYLGIVFEKEGGDQPYFIPSMEAKDLTPGMGATQVNAMLETLEPGKYRLRPAYYDTDHENMDYVNAINGYRNYVNLVVAEDGTRTYTNCDRKDDAATAPQMAVTGFNYTGTINKGAAKTYLVTLANYSETDDYYGDLTLVLRSRTGRELGTFPLGNYNTPAGQTLSGNASITLDVLKGNYKIGFRDSYGRDLPGEYSISLQGPVSELTTDLRVNSFTPTDIEPHTTINTITFQVGNYGKTNVVAPKFGIGIYKVGESQGKGWTWSYPQATLNVNYIYTLRLNGLPVNLDEGEYNVEMYWYPANEDGTEGTERVLIGKGIRMRVGYPVTMLSFADNRLELETGKSARADVTIYPENATFRTLTWTSANPAVATVDSEGNITGVAAGTAYVTATAYNGASANVLVKVSGESGVEDILASAEPILAVYTLTGVKLLDAPADADLQSLAPGLYIAVTASGSYKMLR